VKAVVYERYGPPEVLRVDEIERPAPKDNEVLVKVHATTVNRTDCGFRDPRPWFVRFFSGLVRPRRPVLGTEFAGEIDAVGAAVTEFGRGDRVFGVNADRFGAHAEYLRVRERGAIAVMPASMTFEEGAAICDGFVIALKCLRSGRLQAGNRILIYGASGSIGTAGVQLAKQIGAHVTAVCNTENVDVVKSLGADAIIDYTREPFLHDDERYDVILDAVGKIAFGRCKASLKPGGFYVDTDLGYFWQVPALALWTRFFGSKRVLLPIPRYRKEQVLFARELVEAGSYRAVIDRTYPLDAVVEATRYVETEQKTGNVVLLVDHGQPPQ